MKDIDNYDYLRGWIDGQGSDCHKDSLPEGINSYDEAINRMDELRSKISNKATATTIVNVEIGSTQLLGQSKCKLELSNGQYIMFPFPNNITLKEWEKL